MSWLLFQRSSGSVRLFRGPVCALAANGTVPEAIYPAHNETTATSQGAWPKGVWNWSHYNPHAQVGMGPACHATAYGCSGTHVFSVTGRSGMAVHAGRTFGQPYVLGGRTLGCIRVPAAAMTHINQLHREEPLEVIVVQS